MTVLDASALLAFLKDEPGALRVAEALQEGSHMSLINVSEVLSKLADWGSAPQDVLVQLEAEGVLGGAITIQPFMQIDSLEVARLRPLTRAQGLSLGDRACLALACRLGIPVLTTDKAWAGIEIPGLWVEVIR